MARHYHKSWQDKRPKFTDRVRWYEPEFEWEGVKLTFDNSDGIRREYYKDPAKAQIAYDAFRNSGAILAEKEIT